MFHLRLLAAILGFVAASLYGVAIAVLRRDRSGVASDYARAIAAMMQPPLGIRLSVTGAERLHPPHPSVFVVNHQSAYDVPLLAGLYPRGTVVIGKKELSHIPFFGWMFAATGNILIDRRDNASAVGRLKEAEQAVRERGVSVWIFPEGTRGAGRGQLLPFKKGAFYLAVATGAPLVPIVVEPIQPIFDLRARRLRPARVRVRVLEPIPTAGRGEGEVPALLGETQARMQAALDELAGAPAPPQVAARIA